jgi:polyisoprenoid-binding protein YceI
MSIAITETTLPTGTWTVDPAHSTVGFSVKHLGIATVRGKFSEFGGTLEIGPDPESARAYGSVVAGSVDTGVEDRDAHLRSPDFFDVDTHPVLSFESTAIRAGGEDTFEIEGQLSIHGVTNTVVLTAELQGTETDPWDNERVALDVSGTLNRSDYGMTFNQALGSGNVLVSDKVKLNLELSAVKQGG